MAGLMDAFASIESGGNPMTWNRLRNGRMSRYRGLFQFGPDQERRFGITDWTNPEQQRQAFGQHIEGLRGDLSRRLGRAPADWELYFGHQQGPAGSAALLSAAPGTSAWQAIRRYYGSDALAQQAITGNIPRDHPLARMSPDQITAADFAQMWQQRFGRAMPGGGTGGGGAPTTAPLGAPPPAPTLTAGEPSPTGASWLQNIGAGLSGAMSAFSPISSASAQTPSRKGSRENPYQETDDVGQAREGDFLLHQGQLMEVRGGTAQPVQVVRTIERSSPPPPAPTQVGGGLGALMQAPGFMALPGAPSQPAPEPTSAPGALGALMQSPGFMALPGAPSPPAPTQVAGGLGTLMQTPGFMALPGDPSTTPRRTTPPEVLASPGDERLQVPPRNYGHPMGEAQTLPEGRSLSMPVPPPAPPPGPPPAPTGGPPQPGFLDRLMQNPAFLAGLSILGTAPGGNWGPAGAQAASQAFRAQRERTEFERTQQRRSVMDRVWGQAFPNGAPNMQHPLMQGLPPEMAQTIFAMGPEEGLPQLQRWQFFRGQQQEQRRIRQTELSAFGLGPPPEQAPPSEETQLNAFLNRSRAGAGLEPLADPTAGALASPVGGGTPITPPSGSGVGLAQPPPGALPSTTAPTTGRREPVVRIGTRELPVSQARALALATPDAGMRSVIEEAVKAAEREAQPPEAIRTRALQADSAYRSVSTALQQYQQLVQDPNIMLRASQPGQTRDAVQQLRTHILLQLKELHNLGVLNGPDLTLMERLIIDPTVSPGNLWSAPNTRIGPSITRLMEMLRTMRNAQTDAVGMPPIPSPSSSSAPPSSGGGSRSGGGITVRRIE